MRSLTPTEKSKGIKFDVNNRDHILKELYTLDLVEDYMYDVMTSTKDASGKYIKTQEVLIDKTLALQAEKYNDQCYKKYLVEKQKNNKPKASNSIQRNKQHRLNIKR